MANSYHWDGLISAVYTQIAVLLYISRVRNSCRLLTVKLIIIAP
jgi:hypothetical protein